MIDEREDEDEDEDPPDYDCAPSHGFCRRCGKRCEGDRMYCELCRGFETEAYP